MKIALLSTTIYKLKEYYDSYGGIEPICGNLAQELAKKGHEVTVFAPKGSYLGKNVKIVETVEASINYNPEFEKQATDIMMDYLKDHPVDIIHDHTHQKYIYLHKAEKPGLKVCSTLHNQLNFNSTPPGVPRMNLIGISNNHCAEASAILGIHLEKVYNGINIDTFIYNENKEDYYLFFSRLGRMKGAHEAIEAAKRGGFKLIVAGEDVFVNDPKYVMDIMWQCDGKQIKYLGTVSDAKKIELLSKSKALILPLLWSEPFGIITLEALASGTPVITTPRGSMPEIITHKVDGIFTYNVEEILNAVSIIDSLKHKTCRDKAKKFTIEKMAENYLEIYKRILNGYEW